MIIITNQHILSHLLININDIKLIFKHQKIKTFLIHGNKHKYHVSHQLNYMNDKFVKLTWFVHCKWLASLKLYQYIVERCMNDLVMV